MKMSEVTVKDLKKYANVFHDSDDSLFNAILMACKGFIRSYTGLDNTQIDNYEELPIALFVLAVEMYDNRAYTVENDKVNMVVKSILDIHSRNLL
jgi:hypothetical protein